MRGGDTEQVYSNRFSLLADAVGHLRSRLSLHHLQLYLVFLAMHTEGHGSVQRRSIRTDLRQTEDMFVPSCLLLYLFS